MTKQEEPSYRTEYKTSGKLVCPETGTDLSNYSAEGIIAHAENIFPHAARENFSEEAAERKAILLEMAKGKKE